MYKLIIADDEQIVCQALEHKIREMMPELIILPSVFDGLSLFKTVQQMRPDIAIVDINMPGLSGLDAIELLRARKIDLKIIINTSYSDFSYIQKALQLGASDYLLKPGNKQGLLAALQKIILQLDAEQVQFREREDNRQLVDDLLRVAGAKWMISLMMGAQDKDCLQLIVNRLSCVERGGYFTVWKPMAREENWQERIVQLLSEFCRCINYEQNNMLYCFLAFNSGQKDDIDSVHRMLDYVCARMNREGKTVQVGCSRQKRNAEDYVAGMHEAIAALQLGKGAGISMFRYMREDTESGKQPYQFANLAQTIVSKAMQKGSEAALSELQSFLKSDATGSLPMEELRAQAGVFLSEIHMKAEELEGQDLALFIPIVPWEGLRLAANRDSIMKCIEETIISVIGTFGAESPRNAYVRRTLIYIHENFSKEISLDMAAQTLGISSFYLSRLIRQEVNTTFVELLTDIRMRTAINLLRTTNMSGTEMAAATGYATAAYFYRVFKKTVGITYREMKLLLT